MLMNLEKQFLKISFVTTFPSFLKSIIISIFRVGESSPLVLFLNKS